MRQIFVRIVVTGALLALCLVGTKSKLAAEPIGGNAAAVPAGTSAQPQEVTDALAKFKEGKYDEALKFLRAATKKNPDMPPATLFIVQWCGEANLGQGVRQYLEQTVAELPNDPEAYVLMANSAMRERRITEAAMLYQKAADVMGKFTESKKRKDLIQPQIYAGLASVADSRQDWATAQKHLEEWLKFDPKSAMAMRGLARCLFQQKNAKGALEKLRDAAKVDAEQLTPEALLAQYYERGGDHENAKKYMAEALKVAPKDAHTRLVVAQWALETGQLEEAKSQAAEALVLDPKSVDAKLLSGAIALFQKNYPAAQAYFEQAVMQAPGVFACSNNLALALVEQTGESKRQLALQYAQNNAKQYARSNNAAEAASTYGWVLFKLGKVEEAQKALEIAVSGGSFSPDTAYYMAQVLAKRGRDEQARQWAEAALRSTAPFLMRQETEELVKELKK